MTDFKMIPLSEIHPDKNQPRKFFDDHSLQELTESIREKGVLQPIVVRPNGNGYILVCGERRYRASVAVQAAVKTRSEIPAVVRSLTDDEALEIQFVENIQRSDVHPMDEASTFKQMMENKLHPYTIADIAAKINKPESYVAHRLVLNNLLPSLQKEFWAGKFLIGHAILFARLSSEDQKEVDKQCRDWRSKEFKSVNEVRSYIDINIIKNLSSAPFKKDDPTLNPEMGACTTCRFRSGANTTLFNDIKETDRCLNPACFEKKCNAGLVLQVKKLIEEHPETIFLDYGYTKPLPEISKLMSDYKIKPLKDDGKSFSVYTSYGKKAKGFWISGHKVGKFETIYLKGVDNEKSSSSSEDSVNSFDVEIAGIKQRTKRAAELDDEKVWLRIHHEIIHTKSANESRMNPDLMGNKNLSPIDIAALIYAMFEKCSAGDKILNVFGFKESSYGGYLYGKDKFKASAKFLTASPEQFNQVCRIFIVSVLDSAVSSHTADAGHSLLKQVAEQYKKQEIAVFELEQKEKREKRENRAAVRIKALQTQKKEQAAKKPVAKKAPKVKSKKK